MITVSEIATWFAGFGMPPTLAWLVTVAVVLMLVGVVLRIVLPITAGLLSLVYVLFGRR